VNGPVIEVQNLKKTHDEVRAVDGAGSASSAAAGIEPGERTAHERHYAMRRGSGTGPRRELEE
jgi:hypothetical protein